MLTRRSLLLFPPALAALQHARRAAASSPSAPAHEVVQSDAGYIVVHDSMGEKTFRTHPKRAVALQWDILENLIALGVTPVGAGDIAPWNAWVVDPKLPEGIADVGTRAEPNLERIAALKPDVILIGPTQLDLLPQFSELAPVLVFENYRADAPQGEAETAVAQLRELGRLFGREAEAEAVVKRIDAGLHELGARVRAAFGTTPQVQVIRFSSLTTLFVYTPNSITDYALRRMGIHQPFERLNAGYGLTQVRIRDLKDLEDAYVIYARPFALEKKVMNSILWSATPFARKGRVAAAEAYWSHGGALSILVTAERVVTALLTLAPGAEDAAKNPEEAAAKAAADLTGP